MKNDFMARYWRSLMLLLIAFMSHLLVLLITSFTAPYFETFVSLTDSYRQAHLLTGIIVALALFVAWISEDYETTK